MNEQTLWQWWQHLPESKCPDCSWLLLHLVAEHDGAKRVAHPGYRRLELITGRSRAWITTHLRHLEAAGHIVKVAEGKWAGHHHDGATEWAIPWLTNRPHRRESRAIGRAIGRAIPAPMGRAHPVTTSQGGGDGSNGRPSGPGRVDDQGFEHPAFCACVDCDPSRRSA